MQDTEKPSFSTVDRRFPAPKTIVSIRQAGLNRLLRTVSERVNDQVDLFIEN